MAVLDAPRLGVPAPPDSPQNVPGVGPTPPPGPDDPLLPGPEPPAREPDREGDGEEDEE